MRQDVINSAAEFLRAPSVSSSSLESQLRFLQEKDVTVEEVAMALETVGRTEDAKRVRQQSMSGGSTNARQDNNWVQATGDTTDAYPYPAPPILVRDGVSWGFLALFGAVVTAAGGVGALFLRRWTQAQEAKNEQTQQRIRSLEQSHEQLEQATQQSAEREKLLRDAITQLKDEAASSTQALRNIQQSLNLLNTRSTRMLDRLDSQEDTRSQASATVTTARETVADSPGAATPNFSLPSTITSLLSRNANDDDLAFLSTPVSHEKSEETRVTVTDSLGGTRVSTVSDSSGPRVDSDDAVAALDDAFRTMMAEEVDPSTVSTLLMYLSKAETHPDCPVRRKIRVYNATFAKRVASDPNAIDFLVKAGFKRNGAAYELPTVGDAERDSAQEQLLRHAVRLLQAFPETVVAEASPKSPTPLETSADVPAKVPAKSFAEIADMVARGETPDDVRVIDDSPVAATLPSDAAIDQAPPKPWEHFRARNDDEIMASSSSDSDCAAAAGS